MSPRKPSMRSKIFQTIKDYAGRSSIHGIGYIFDKDLHLVDRLLWLLLVVVFGGVAATLTWDFWFQWRNSIFEILSQNSYSYIIFCGYPTHPLSIKKVLKSHT